MAKKEIEKKRKIPRKNYLLAIILIVATVAITTYIFQLYNLSQENKLSKSYLITSNAILHEIKSITELPEALSEAPSEYFLYISYTKDKDIYNLERDLVSIIKEYDFKDEFYYLNVTDIKDQNDYINQINTALNLNVKITSVPTIIYIKDGAAPDGGVVTRDDKKVIDAGDFAKMLDILEIPVPKK